MQYSMSLYSDMLLKLIRGKWISWTKQVPVFGFNSVANMN